LAVLFKSFEKLADAPVQQSTNARAAQHATEIAKQATNSRLLRPTAKL
jgi:hypothetical protein